MDFLKQISFAMVCKAAKTQTSTMAAIEPEQMTACQ
jgi:hypothetical protein